MLAGFQCAGCGEWNETTVDETAGSRQSYIEDCQVCCRPNILRAEYDRESEQCVISAEAGVGSRFRIAIENGMC